MGTKIEERLKKVLKDKDILKEIASEIKKEIYKR